MYNYNYGKLENNTLIYAPIAGTVEEEIEVEDEETGEKTTETVSVFYSPLSNAQLESLGYKQVVNTDKPDDGNIYSSSWKESANAITQIWTLTHVVTNKEKRQQQYATKKCVELEDKELTIDEANNEYLWYIAEGNTEIASEIATKIKVQKDIIREEYPDED